MQPCLLLRLRNPFSLAIETGWKEVTVAKPIPLHDHKPKNDLSYAKLVYYNTSDLIYSIVYMRK